MLPIGPIVRANMTRAAIDFKRRTGTWLRDEEPAGSNPATPGQLMPLHIAQ
jgi:hypothetical protein